MPGSEVGAVVGIENLRDAADVPMGMRFAPDPLAESKGSSQRRWRIEADVVAGDGSAIVVDHDRQPWPRINRLRESAKCRVARDRPARQHSAVQLRVDEPGRTSRRRSWFRGEQASADQREVRGPGGRPSRIQGRARHLPLRTAAPGDRRVSGILRFPGLVA